MNLEVIILAAGQGTRMHSDFPKVLHQVANKSLIEHIYSTASALTPKNIHVVIGHCGDKVIEATNLKVNWIKQASRLGTGHAVMQALPDISDASQVLILPGDVPCLSETTLQHLIKQTPINGIGVLTAKVNNPHGLGRIVRDESDHFIAIVEEKDASETEKNINEINAGVMLAPAHILKQLLPQVVNHNAQNEYYLTDLPHLALQEKIKVVAVRCLDADEIQGVNDRWQLSLVERYYQQKQAKALMTNGVTIRDFSRFDLRGNLTTGKDVEFDINVLLEGDVSIGNHCHIGANVILRNVKIGDHVDIKDNSVIEDAVIGNDCRIGPFARIRPGTVLANAVQIGNFVELKKSIVANGSKINHLSYVGDAIIGQNVNVGAGVITCNYDGVNKFKTTIEDEAFIGSNTSLVAPLTISYRSTIGAGSTISKDTEQNQLTLSRAKQLTIPGWQRPTKQEI